MAEKETEDVSEKVIRLRNTVLEHSVSKVLTDAFAEWVIVDYEEEYTYCLCKKDIKHVFTLFNTRNNNILTPIGCDCVKHFKELEPEKHPKYIKVMRRIRFEGKKDKLGGFDYCINCFKITKRDFDKRFNHKLFCNDCKLIYKDWQRDGIHNRIKLFYNEPREVLINYKNKPFKYRKVINEEYINKLIMNKETRIKLSNKFANYRFMNIRELRDTQFYTKITDTEFINKYCKSKEVIFYKDRTHYSFCNYIVSVNSNIKSIKREDLTITNVKNNNIVLFEEDTFNSKIKTKNKRNTKYIKLLTECLNLVVLE